jgi:hypothetical protein
MRTHLIFFIVAVLSLTISPISLTSNAASSKLEISAITDTRPGEVEVTFNSKIAKSLISSYQITAKPKTSTGASFSKSYKSKVSGLFSHKISNLAPNVEYIFTIRLTTKGKQVITSASFNHLSSSTTPTAPLITKAVATDADQAVVFFDAPIDDGGTKIYYYTALSNPGGISSLSPQLGPGSITITGLSKSTTYTFTINAFNINGSSLLSKPSPPVTTLAEKIVRSSTSSTTGPTLAAPAFTLSSSSQTVVVSNAITTVTNTSTGGAIASYAISPAAPAGLTFSTTTGQLSGTPTATQSSTPYTITATNATASTAQTFTFTVTAAVAAPAFTLSASTESRPVNTAATGFTIATSTGGTIASFGINATPPGMSFNTSTGALTGTPNTVATATAFTITATNTAGSVTQTFTLTVTAAVAIFTQPIGGANATALSTQPVVRVVDGSGNAIASFTSNVVATIASGTGTLSGTTTVAAVAGVATFTNLVITGTAGAFTLRFTPAGLTAATSNSLTVTAGAENEYLVTSSSTSPAAGSAVTISAQLTDISGNAISTAGKTVTWSKSNANGSFATTTSTTNAAGIATVSFTVHTVSATSTTVTATSSTPTLTGTGSTITTVTGAASKIAVFSAGSPTRILFQNQPSFRIQDAFSNNVLTSSATITAALTAGTGGTIQGTLTAVAAGAFGRATFTNLGVDGVISNSYTITYSSPGLTSSVVAYTLLGNFCDEFQGVLTGTTCNSTNGNQAELKNILIFSGYTLILNDNSSSVGSITNDGAVINKGTYSLSGFGITNRSGSTFTNEGTLDLNAAPYINNSGATTTNTTDATINLNGNNITTFGIFNNFGTINLGANTIIGTITGNPPN